MAIERISWPISMKECCWTWESYPRLSTYQADTHPTELPCPAYTSLKQTTKNKEINNFIWENQVFSWAIPQCTLPGKGMLGTPFKTKHCHRFIVIKQLESLVLAYTHFYYFFPNLWISKNRFLDIKNSIFGYPKFNFWISNNQFDFVISKNQILDIQNLIYGYPQIKLWISKNLVEYWITIIRFLDIHNSIYGYPNIMLNIGYPIRAVAGQCSLPDLSFANKTKMFFSAKNERRKITGP